MQLAPLLLDHGGQPEVLLLLERVGRHGAEGVVGGGDGPVQPVGLDGQGGLLPAVAVAGVGRWRTERGRQVPGRGVPGTGETLRGGLLQLRRKRVVLVLQGGDLLAGRQTGTNGWWSSRRVRSTVTSPSICLQIRDTELLEIPESQPSALTRSSTFLVEVPVM